MVVVVVVVVLLLLLLLLLPPATKLGQGYIFTGVCDSVHGGGLVPGRWVPGPGVPGPEGVHGLGGAWSQGGAWWRPPRTATAAGGTHPTGMHSCCCC